MTAVRTTGEPPAARTTGRRRRPPSAFTVVLATLVGLALLAITVPNVGPVMRAARADGPRGTFTAQRVSCVQHPGHEQCTWYGTFQLPASSSGPGSGSAVRHDYYLYGANRGTLHTGQQVTAVDVGRKGRVYDPAGSHEWILTGLLLLAGLALFVPLGRRVVGAVSSRRATSAGESDR
ncbi:hypothetical protein J4573_41800 [Actinomadura barringtoniae]|uniref:Uncharacterized protein n=1 Tax=Actinomadura barringtoniae TaxID=1427535 RepID=A0A939TBM0_9ACTN|nr:hypothetical protein [Actinomadura barringtoniae]MBO2453682.1 hypothetical protein [Actinomadura barringtoniae]